MEVFSLLVVLSLYVLLLFGQAGGVIVCNTAQIVLGSLCCLSLMLMLDHDASLCAADKTTPSAVPAQTWVYVVHCCRCCCCGDQCIVPTGHLLHGW